MALEALETGDLVKAKSLGDAASAEAVSSMALLPDSSSLPAETIDSLKAQGLHPLADSLANVRRMIDANVFTLKFLGGLAKFGKDEAGEATIAKARGLNFCALSLNHCLNVLHHFDIIFLLTMCVFPTHFTAGQNFFKLVIFCKFLRKIYLSCKFLEHFLPKYLHISVFLYHFPKV